jgi:hypothetical protein
MQGTQGQCSWLYCVAASSDAAVPDGIAGVAGEPIEEVNADQLTAFIGSVPEAEYGLDALRRNLEDLDWLAECAEAHHQVISDIAATRAVTPMRLATICRDARGVADLLGRRAGELRSSIAHVTGRDEWGLKAYLRATAADAAAAEPADDSGASASPGTAYLARRRQAVASRQEARLEACSSAERLISAVDSMAVDARDHQLHDASLDQAAADMIVNRSYLVDDREAAEFSAAVDDLAAEFPGLRVELTGPWPVYSFAVPDQEPTS